MNDPILAEDYEAPPSRARSALRPRRLAGILFLLGAVAFVLPVAIMWLAVIAGFVIANEAKRIDPKSTGESLGAIALMATATGLVLSGPWLGVPLPPLHEHNSLDYISLPHLKLLGASQAMCVGGWLTVVALGSWLTYSTESLWVQFGVLLFALGPWTLVLMFISAMTNA